MKDSVLDLRVHVLEQALKDVHVLPLSPLAPLVWERLRLLRLKVKLVAQLYLSVEWKLS